MSDVNSKQCLWYFREDDGKYYVYVITQKGKTPLIGTFSHFLPPVHLSFFDQEEAEDFCLRNSVFHGDLSRSEVYSLISSVAKTSFFSADFDESKGRVKICQNDEDVLDLTLDETLRLYNTLGDLDVVNSDNDYDEDCEDEMLYDGSWNE